MKEVLILDYVSKNIGNIDLVDYLIMKGYKVVRSGNSYRIVVKSPSLNDLSSLSIFSNRRSWKRWSDGTHGGDAIEFCRVVFGMSFQEAVQELGCCTHVDVVPVVAVGGVPSPARGSALILPQRFQGRFSRLFAYLVKTRCLSMDIVNSLVNDGCIYQDVMGNVVFLGFDDFQKVRFACLRGTYSEKPFRKDCSGSDKRYSFRLSGSGSDLYIFESPIDLLSACTMANIMTGNPNEWRKHTRLSLSGVSDVALQYYLSLHQNVTHLHFWLDNDSAGRSASSELCRQYAERGYITFNHCPKNKDMNEDLKELVSH